MAETPPFRGNTYRHSVALKRWIARGGFLGVDPYSNRVKDEFQSWKRSIVELATCPNVVVKPGGPGMLIFGFDLHLRENPPSSEVLAATWKPFLETRIDAFEAERGICESNFPVGKQSRDHSACRNAFKRLSAGASAAEKALLFHDSAARVYWISA